MNGSTGAAEGRPLMGGDVDALLDATRTPAAQAYLLAGSAMTHLQEFRATASSHTDSSDITTLAQALEHHAAALRHTAGGTP